MSQEIQPIAVAVLATLGLAVIVADRVFGGEPFYFWSGVVLLAFCIVALTPLGRRLW